MKVNIQVSKAVKPLNEPIMLKTRLADFMMWSEKTGQIECFIISYENDTLYMISHAKDGKTYTNYFKTFKEMKSTYNILTKYNN